MEPLGPSDPADTSSLQLSVHHFPPPLHICPLKHFRIPNSFFQTASSSKTCRPCMIWLQSPSLASSLAMTPSGHIGLFRYFKQLNSFPPQACYLLLCFLPGLILPASLLLTSNSSFRSPLFWFPELLLIRKHNNYGL